MKNLVLLVIAISSLSGCVSSKPQIDIPNTELFTGLFLCDSELPNIHTKKTGIMYEKINKCRKIYKSLPEKIAGYKQWLQANHSSNYCQELQNLQSRVDKFNFQAPPEDKVTIADGLLSCNDKSSESAVEFDWRSIKDTDRITGKVTDIATSNVQNKLTIFISCDSKRPKLEIVSSSVIGVPSSYHKIAFRVDNNPPYRKKLRLHGNSYESGYLYNVNKLISEMQAGKSIFVRVDGHDGYQESEISLYGAKKAIDNALTSCR